MFFGKSEEKTVPGVTDFINSFHTTPQSTTKLPYSRELSQEDQNYLHRKCIIENSVIIQNNVLVLVFVYFQGFFIVIIAKVIAFHHLFIELKMHK